MKKLTLIAIIFFVIGAAVGFGISRFSYDSRTASDMSEDALMYDEANQEMEEDIESSAENGDGNLLTVADPQAAGRNVMVIKASVARAGWVVVHEDRAGNPGNILGALRLDPGSHLGLVVELLRETVGGQTYYAMLHSDNGDKKFDHAVDLPVQGEDGSSVMQKFTVTQ